ncbi:tetratricopeptide repeat protein, partial [Candidatus Amoebophilus asiaticus]|nr:tetratricopeptide repeat protein [Candidatus Amoebophilus asiaticus]
ATIYNNMGIIFAAQGKLEKALDYQLKALTIQEELDDKFGMIHSSICLGETYIKIKDFEKAQKFLQNSANIGKTIGAKPMLSESYKLLSYLFSEKNDYEQAWGYTKRYVELKDSLLNENNQQIIL